jgi:hypothetical protein
MIGLNSTPMTTPWRLPLSRLRRAARMAIVAACKLALLFSMLESAGQAAELSGEALDSVNVETANVVEGYAAATRTVGAKRLAVRGLRRAPGLAGSGVERSPGGSRTAGHRLPNGLGAPLKC